MRLTRISSTVLAAACLLSLTATNSYGSTTATPTAMPTAAMAAPAADPATTTTPVFKAPYDLWRSRLLAVQGAVGGAQKLTVQGVVGEVSVGTVVVSKPGRVAPAGLLVKVVSIARSGDNTVLSVVPAGLAEALAPGTYDKQVGMTSPTGKASLIPAPGVVGAASGSSDRQKVTIDKLVSCTGSVSSVHITGSLTVQPTVDLSLHVHGGSLIPFYLPYVDRMAFSAGLTEDAALHASLTAAATCKASFDIGKLTLPAFTIGPVPVVATLKLTADAKLTVEATVSVDATQHFDGLAGVNYADGKMTQFAHFNTEPMAISAKLAGKASLEVGLTGSVGLLAAGVLGVHADARGYLGISADPNLTPWWTTYAGLRVSGGARLSLFGIKDLNLGDWTLYEKKWMLGQAVGVTTASLPAGLAGVPYSARIAVVGGKAPFKYSTSGDLPAGLTMNGDGTITGTPTLDGAETDHTSNFSIVVTDANGDTTAHPYTVAIRRILITTTSLPSTQHGASVNQQLATAGAQGAVSWSLVAGNLPAGLSLSPTGLISGTVDPSAAASNSFTVRATDSTGPTVDQSYSVAVVDPQPDPDPEPRPIPCLDSSIKSGPHIDLPKCRN